ncbi:MAG: glycosyltransferase family 4 protein [Planctomycetes bacterium]|nr:glycosyltransferase family 4 protein [Planctomycetota bacterium]
MPPSIALDYRPALLSDSGIARACRELARALAARDDVELHLFAHSLARARRAIDVPPRAHLHRLPIPGRSLPALRRAGIGADRLAGGARVFHWFDYVHPPVSRARVVLTVHDLAFEHDPSWHGDDAATLRERTRAAIAAAAAIVVPSRTTADDVRRFAPNAPAPSVVPFGADHVPPTGRPDPLAGRPFVLCVGTIEPRKNHRALLAAWRLLREPRPLLVVVGRIGWACEDTVAELAAAGRDGVVDWRQRSSDDELWALLHHARLVVYPSLWEGFGFPPLEAMQAGVPVLANAAAPLRELGDDAMAYCDATDPGAFAAALDRALRDEPFRRDMTARGRTRAASFTWRRCAERHAAIYHEVLG